MRSLLSFLHECRFEHGPGGWNQRPEASLPEGEAQFVGEVHGGQPVRNVDDKVDNLPTGEVGAQVELQLLDDDVQFIAPVCGGCQIFGEVGILQRKAEAEESVVDVHLAGEVVREQRSAHAQAAGEFLHGKGGDAFFAHDGARGFEDGLDGGLPVALDAGGGGFRFAHYPNSISIF